MEEKGTLPADSPGAASGLMGVWCLWHRGQEATFANLCPAFRQMEEGESFYCICLSSAAFCSR